MRGNTRGEVSGEEALHEALERGAHAAVLRAKPRAEEGAERAVLAQDAPGRQAERDEIVRAVEAVVEARRRRAACAAGSKPRTKRCGRLAHPRERPLDPGPEEIDAAVGQARGQERDDLAVGGVGVAQRDSESRPIGAARPVGLAVEPLERCLQPGR